jgi:hypothetical protein
VTALLAALIGGGSALTFWFQFVGWAPGREIPPASGRVAVLALLVCAFAFAAVATGLAPITLPGPERV